MIMMFYLILPLMFLPTLIIYINYTLTKKTMYNREKATPFECGFDPIHLSHTPFSINFFMISLIFLIFDIEITMLIPLIYFMKNYSWNMITYFIFFMLLLLLGLYIEYSESSIDWKT